MATGSNAEKGDDEEVGCLIILPPGVIRDPTFLYLVKEMLLLYYFKVHILSVYYSGSFITYWYHHLILWIDSSLCSALT